MYRLHYPVNVLLLLVVKAHNVKATSVVSAAGQAHINKGLAAWGTLQIKWPLM